MWRKKPELLALFIALISSVVVLAFLVIDLTLTRNRDLNASEQRLQHFSVMMAEHTARSFEAIDILLRELAIDLSTHETNWGKWLPAEGWDYVARRHTRSLPQLRDLVIIDRLGNQRFISTYFPPPAVNVKDQLYFQAMEQGAESASYGPYIGHNSGRYTYSLTRRITGPDKKFTGFAIANMEPAYLQDFCWSSRLSDDFESVLLNARGQIIASCRPTDLSRQAPLLGAFASDVLFAGKLRQLKAKPGLYHLNGLQVSVSPVQGFTDLSILTAIPESTVLASWHHRLLELGALGLIIGILLLIGTLLVRRQIRDMASMTVELAANRQFLEERIREATHELASEKDAAERANKAKSRFLAAASHDLRQPLHALSLFATDLQRQVRSGVVHEQGRLAEQIAASTRVLGELLDSLLDLSRLDVAGIHPEIRSFPLNPIFERLNNSFRRAAADRNITLRFRPTRQWLNSDPVMLERIMANLVSNAVRYTPIGGRILVAARFHGNQVSIDVRDNGVGIAVENQAAIFAEFYQVGNVAREQNKGLGLGLSIVDRLARALSIKVTLRSRLGEGTTFSLLVPIGQPINRNLPESQPKSSGKVHFIGVSEDISACITLVKNWNYQVSQDADPAAHRPPADALVITEAKFASVVSAELSPDTPLIIFTKEDNFPLPEGAHTLPMPIRPAKLRALLNQLQKTLPKSMP